MKYLKTSKNYSFKPSTISDIRKHNFTVNDFCKNIENKNGKIKDIILTSDGKNYLVYYTKEGEISSKTKLI